MALALQPGQRVALWLHKCEHVLPAAWTGTLHGYDPALTDVHEGVGYKERGGEERKSSIVMAMLLQLINACGLRCHLRALSGDVATERPYERGGTVSLLQPIHAPFAMFSEREEEEQAVRASIVPLLWRMNAKLYHCRLAQSDAQQVANKGGRHSEMRELSANAECVLQSDTTPPVRHVSKHRY